MSELGKEKAKAKVEPKVEPTTPVVQAPDLQPSGNTAAQAKVSTPTGTDTGMLDAAANEFSSGPKGTQAPKTTDTTTPGITAEPTADKAVVAQKPHELAAADLQTVMAEAREAIAKDGTTKGAEISGAANKMAAVFAQLKPEQIAEVMKSGGQEAIDFLTANTGTMKPADQAKIIEALASTGESLGREHVETLAQSMLKNMGGYSALESGKMLTGIENGMRSGNGSLLGASLVVAAHKQYNKVPHELMERIGDTAGDIGKQFQASSQAANEKNRELAKWRENAGFMHIDAEHIDAGEERFRSDHKGVYDDHDTKSDVFGANLEGQAYALDMWKDIKYAGSGDSILEKKVDDPNSTFWGQSAGEAFETSLYTATQLTQSDGGRNRLGQKILESGQGRRTWLDTAHDKSASFDARAKKEADGRRHIDYGTQLEQAVGAGGDKALTAMQANRDPAGVKTALQGMANQTRHTDPEFADIIENATTDYEEFVKDWAAKGSKGSDFVKNVGTAFAKSKDLPHMRGSDVVATRRRAKLERLGGALTIGSAAMALTDGADASEVLSLGSGAASMYHSIAHGADDLVDASGKLTKAGKLGALGPGLGAIADGAKILQGNAKVRDYVSFGLSSFETFATVRGALTGSKALGKFAGKLSLITTVAFSAWDTYSAIDRGDWVGAAAAAAPLAGAAIGAALTSWSGPGAAVGALVGAAVGLAVEGVRWMMTPSASSKMESDTWGATATMIQSATGQDWDSSVRLANRMRRVNGDLRGSGPAIGMVASNMGVDPHKLLDHMASQSSDVQDWFIDRAEDVSTNDSARQDQAEAYSKFKIDDPTKIPVLKLDGSATKQLGRELNEMGFGTGQAPSGIERNSWYKWGDKIHN